MTVIKIPKVQLDKYPHIAEYFRSLGWVEGVEDTPDKPIDICKYWVKTEPITDMSNVDNRMTDFQKESIDKMNEFMNGNDVPEDIMEAYHHGVRSWMVTLNYLGKQGGIRMSDNPDEYANPDEYVVIFKSFSTEEVKGMLKRAKDELWRMQQNYDHHTRHIQGLEHLVKSRDTKEDSQ